VAGDVGEEEAGDAAGGAGGEEVDVAAGGGVGVGGGVDPDVEAGDGDGGGGEGVSAPDLHAGHEVIFWHGESPRGFLPRRR
jgi:hypothetical protein